MAVGIGSLVFLITQPWLEEPSESPESMAALSGGSSPQDPQDPLQRPGLWLRELDLTPQQLRNLQQIRQQKQALLADYTQQLKQARKQLRDLYVSDVPNAEIQAHFEQIQALSQKREQVRLEIMLQIRDILTPEQRQQFQRRGTSLRDDS